MERNLILTAETGSDLTPALAAQYGIYLVPMHVTMGEVCLEDGAFPAQDVCAYYDRTGAVPKTSACAPEDFTRVFDAIRAAHPQAQILHLAYSAATTCSYQNAGIASAERDYVLRLDTKQVSVAQAIVAMETAKQIQARPELEAPEAAKFAAELAASLHMCFIPKNLDYLRAGGRLSNVAALTGNLLRLHPCIETVDGKLVATKKYRGGLERIIPKLITEFSEKYRFSREYVYFIRSPGLAPALQALAEQCAAAEGFQSVTWMDTGCVITSHGGPGCFGIVGRSRE